MVGLLCSSARGGHLRAERGHPVRNNFHPPLVQPSRIEVFEELLVPWSSFSRSCAFAAILVPREPLGFGHLAGVGPDARNARLPLLALLERQVVQARA